MDSIQRAQYRAPSTNTAVPGRTEKTEQEVKPQGDSVVLGQPPNQTPKAKWTIMSYIAANCNLEPFQMRNIESMERVGSDPQTNILVQIDRGQKPCQIDGGWTNCRRYLVKKNEGGDPDKLASTMLEDMGRVNMAEPQSLTDFIVWGIKNYPSEHVMLVMNDHGGGFTGALTDNTSGKFMSVPEIAGAIKNAGDITGKKIELVGFDACLMAEHEVGAELQGKADILLASEESESGPGWTYSPMLGGKTLGAALSRMRLMKTDASPEQLAKTIVEVNQEHSRDIPTFSAVNLNNLDQLNSVTNSLAEAIIASRDRTSIKNAIKWSDSYGGGHAPYNDIHDEYDMCDQIAKSPYVMDKAVINAAQAVVDVLKEGGPVVLANENNGTSHKSSHGVSIFAPTSVGPTGPGYKWDNLAFARNTKWGEALKCLGKGEPGASLIDDSLKMPEVWPDGSVRKNNQ